MNTPRLSDIWTDDEIHSAVARDRRFRALRALLLFQAAIGSIVFCLVVAIGGSYDVGSLAFTPDGRTLVGSVNGYDLPPMHLYGIIRTWNVETGKPVARLAGPGTWLRSFAISPDGSTIAVAGDTPVIELSDLPRGTRIARLDGHAGNVREVVFSPTGPILASSHEGEVLLWDVATGKTRATLPDDQSGAYHLTFGPGGKSLATVDTAGIRLWDTSDGHLIRQIDGGKEWTHRLGLLGFTEDGKDLILSRHVGRHGEVAAVVDGSTQADRFEFTERRRLCLQLSPDSRTLAVGEWSGAVSILDAVSGRTLVRLNGLRSKVVSLAFSSDGALLAGADSESRGRIWETNTGRLHTSFSADEPVRRWGPTGVLILFWIGATLRIRRRSRMSAPLRTDP